MWAMTSDILFMSIFWFGISDANDVAIERFQSVSRSQQLISPNTVRKRTSASQPDFLLPRLDNRNLFQTSSVLARPKPKCNKRIRIANGVTRFRDKGAFVRYACSDGFTLIGATIGVCLRDQWSEQPPICVRPGCRRILSPLNGFARLTHSGAVAEFMCKPTYDLEGSEILFCNGNRWNGTEPVCIPINPPTSTTEIWEWGQQTGDGDDTGSGFESSTGDNHDESWDYNNPSSSFSTLTTSRNSEIDSTTGQDKSSSKSIGELSTFSSTTAASFTTSEKNEEVTEKIIDAASFTTKTQQPEPSKEVSTSSIITTVSHKSPTEYTTESFTSTTSGTITPTDSQFPESFNNLSAKETSKSESYTPLLESEEMKTTLIPELIQPLQPIYPHKLGDDAHHEYYKHVAEIAIVGITVVGILGTFSLIASVATYCWRRNIGIARRSTSEIDGRMLSGSEANEDFMWMDSRDQYNSRL